MGTRTWSDNAGNSGNQIITVTDTGVQATDDCSAVVVTFSDSTPTTSCDVASCTQSVSIVRTWNAVDDCGNQAASQAQVIFEDCSEDVFVCPTATPVPTVEEDCRFICDDDDSAASSLIASVFV